MEARALLQRGGGSDASPASARSCGDAARASLGDQMFVMAALKTVSNAVIDAKGSKAEVIAVARAELGRIPWPAHGFSLPIRPTFVCGRPILERCRVMFSKKKPLWLEFAPAEGWPGDAHGPPGSTYTIMVRRGAGAGHVRFFSPWTLYPSPGAVQEWRRPPAGPARAAGAPAVVGRREGRMRMRMRMPPYCEPRPWPPCFSYLPALLPPRSSASWTASGRPRASTSASRPTPASRQETR